jgi:hypothetical protein
LKEELPTDWGLGTVDNIDWDEVFSKEVLKQVLDKVNYSERFASWHKDYNQIY